MKKTLIALAVLSTAGAVAAQSSVTLYGVADFGTNISSESATFELAVRGGPTARSTFKVRDADVFGAEGQAAGNRIGLKGTEDLGGGIKLGFNYEFGLNADHTGTGRNFIGNTRLANLSLSSDDFGRVTIGTLKNNFDAVRDIQPTNETLTTGNAVNSYDGVGRIGGTSVNSLNYTYTKNPIWAGVDIGHRRQARSIGSTTTKDAWTQYTVGAGYNDGTLKAGLAWGSATGTSEAAGRLRVGYVDDMLNPAAITRGERETPEASGKSSNLALAASYNIGMFTPFAAFEQSKLTADRDSVHSNTATNNAFALGATAEFGATTAWLAGGMGRTKYKLWVDARNGWNEPTARTTAIEFGAKYALSKRTDLYGVASYAQAKKSRFSLDSGMTTYATTNKRTSLAAGISHKF